MARSPSLTVTLLAAASLVSAALSPGCGRQPHDEKGHQTALQMKSIDDVIRVYADSLMKIPGVVGLYHGLGTAGEPCLKVMVKARTPELERRIPKELEGYPVIIDETGEIKPMH